MLVRMSDLDGNNVFQVLHILKECHCILYQHCRKCKDYVSAVLSLFVILLYTVSTNVSS